MGGLLTLLEELHRRAVWRAGAVFIGASWVILQVADLFIDRGFLPDWAFAGCIVALALGAPIVLATAWFQGRNRAPSTVAPGGEAAPPPARGEPEGDTLRRVFTWRRALLGGVGAFALLGLGAMAYMLMRSLGIGAPGTLVAKGVLEEGGRVVLADFASGSGVADFSGDVITEALRTDLEQSPTIDLLSPTEVAAVLDRMQRDDVVALDEPLAREVALREGAPAVIAGEISALGGRYLLTARILDSGSGDVLAAFRQTARDSTQIIDAVDALSRDVRDKVGESFRSIQASPPLARVTTSSLAALRTYTDAHRAEMKGEGPKAVALYEEAIRLDPDFAMAYRKLGVVLGNSGEQRARQIQAITTAWNLRERLPPLERLLAEATYHRSVTGNRDAIINAYERVLALDPVNHVATNNLGIEYQSAGDVEKGLEYFIRALEQEPGASSYANVAESQFWLGHTDAAFSTIEELRRDFPNSFLGPRANAKLLAAIGEYERADSTAQQMKVDMPESSVAKLEADLLLGELDGLRGRIREAALHIQDVYRADVADSAHAFILSDRLWEARFRVVHLDDTAQAERIVTEALAAYPLELLSPLERPYEDLVLYYLAAGRDQEASQILDESVRAVRELTPASVWVRDGSRLARAELLVRGGHPEAALDTIASVLADCPLCDQAYRPRGTAARAAGRLEEAAAAFEQWLNRGDFDRIYADAVDLPDVLWSLAQVYEELGDKARAAATLERFAELWKDADPELQPRVEAARLRARRLRGEPPVA